ncbi:MAG: hypothetical protein CM1200mP2_26930 [Planctomycetaceae bacterium]|nr:MAG: hypothetical protein CM1200mP2_26930 [Planctomycetaceae bacterium]
MQRDQMLERTNTLVALVLLVSPAVTLAEDPVARKPKTAKVTFRDQIGPLFRRRCTGCHGGGQPKADLDLSRYVAAMAGGSSGEVLVPGDPLQSRLYLLASHAEEPHMPPKRPRLPGRPN